MHFSLCIHLSLSLFATCTHYGLYIMDSMLYYLSNTCFNTCTPTLWFMYHVSIYLYVSLPLSLTHALWVVYHVLCNSPLTHIMVILSCALLLFHLVTCSMKNKSTAQCVFFIMYSTMLTLTKADTCACVHAKRDVMVFV